MVKQLAIFWKCSAEATNCFRVGFLLDAWTLPTPLFSTAEMPCPGPSRVISEFWEKHFKFFRHVEIYDDRCNHDAMLERCFGSSTCQFDRTPDSFAVVTAGSIASIYVLNFQSYWSRLFVLGLPNAVEASAVSHPPAPGRTDLESLSRWWPSQEGGRSQSQRFSSFSDGVAFGSWWLPPLQRNIVQNWFGSM